MSNPPTGIDAADLFAAITQIPRPFRVVDFPRKLPNSEEPVGRLILVVLSQEEQMEASAAAERVTRRFLKDPTKSDEARKGYEDVYLNAAAVEVLWRSCRKIDDVEKKLFPTPDEIRKHLLADEIGVLTAMYLTTQAELGPIVARMSDAEVEAWIERLAEGGSTFPLDFLSPDARSHLVITMARRIRDFTTATSSSGSPPAESSPSRPRESDESDSPPQP